MLGMHTSATDENSYPDGLTDVEELSLQKRHIQRISDLCKFTALKRLYLNDNEITRIEGLNNCKALTELSLEVCGCLHL